MNIRNFYKYLVQCNIYNIRFEGIYERRAEQIFSLAYTSRYYCMCMHKRGGRAKKKINNTSIRKCAGKSSSMFIFWVAEVKEIVFACNESFTFDVKISRALVEVFM